MFDEVRVFKPGPMPGPVDFRGVRLGLPICEDIWLPDVTECLAETGAELLIVPNGSPYWSDKEDVRMQIAVARVVETGLPMIYANQIGGQDELVFDGGSFGLHADRTLAFQMQQFETGVAMTRWERGGRRLALHRRADGEPAVERVAPTGRPACWACATMSRRTASRASCSAFPAASIRPSARRWRSMRWAPSRVRCIMLPYRYTAEDSLTDAADCAKRLGVQYDVLPIAPAVEGFETLLAPLFDGLPRDMTEENIQSRTRGTALMAVSNKLGLMLVTTGNKSEVSVGYATIYGDMNGGFNPIKDLYKTQVYRLSRYRNRERPPGCLGPDGEIIPVNIIDKAADRGAAREPEGPGFAAALRRARRDPRMPGGEGDAGAGDRGARLRPRHGQARRAPALPRRIQAPAGGAGREDHAEEFRARPPLSDHQPFSRQRLGALEW